jgi:hypothetical protein
VLTLVVLHLYTWSITTCSSSSVSLWPPFVAERHVAHTYARGEVAMLAPGQVKLNWVRLHSVDGGGGGSGRVGAIGEFVELGRLAELRIARGPRLICILFCFDCCCTRNSLLVLAGLQRTCWTKRVG